MNSEIARAGLLIGSFLLVGGIPLLIVLEPGTAEHTITLITVLTAILFIVALGIAVRISQR